MRKSFPFAPGAVSRHRRARRDAVWRYLQAAVLMVFWSVLIGLWIGVAS